MTATTWFVFAIGAGLGAPLRFVIDAAVQRPRRAGWPRGTLVVNGAGSLLFGVITGLTLEGHVSDDVSTIVGSGFCGAFTTFSTFAVDTVRLLEAGAMDEALKNVAVNASVSIGLAAAGYGIVLSAF